MATLPKGKFINVPARTRVETWALGNAESEATLAFYSDGPAVLTVTRKFDTPDAAAEFLRGSGFRYIGTIIPKKGKR